MKRVPTRVLHVINGRAIGGAERLLLSMAPLFDASAVRLSFANTFFDSGTFVEALRELDVDFVALPASRMRDVPGLIYRLAVYIRRQEIDIVHTHLLHSTLAGHAATRLARKPLVVMTRHYTDEAYVGKSPLVAAADRHAARAATHVVAVSEFVRRHLVDCGVREERISLIHNGIDVASFDFDRPSQAVAGPVRIGMVGNLNWSKGHRLLIEAFSRLPEGLATLTLIGEGAERKPLESLIDSLGIHHRVLLAGFDSDIRKHLRAFDIYVQPSLNETFGISLVEALAARLPVIATRTGGIPEIVDDGRTGLLVPPGDAEALTDAMMRLIASPDLRQRLADSGRSRVEVDFDIGRTTRRYEALYQQLIERHRPKGKE